MKISLLEPIGVSREEIEALAAPVRAKGHTFVYYDTKTTDAEELKQGSEGCEVVMIANNPYPAEVVRGGRGASDAQRTRLPALTTSGLKPAAKGA